MKSFDPLLLGILGGLLLFILLLGVGLLVLNIRVKRLRQQMKGQDELRQTQLSDKLSRLSQELERKTALKERELHAELNALSMAMTALKSYHAAPSAGDVAPDDDANDDDADEGEEKESSHISSDACFFNLPGIFIRNEQRLVATEGGVSITTANKWLDAWERNGWIERISRGKYMKTAKGKKITLHYMPQG